MVTAIALSGSFPWKDERAAIKAVYEGKDLFVCMPTSYTRVCATKLFLLFSPTSKYSAFICSHLRASNCVSPLP